MYCHMVRLIVQIRVSLPKIIYILCLTSIFYLSLRFIKVLIEQLTLAGATLLQVNYLAQLGVSTLIPNWDIKLDFWALNI